MKEKEIYNIDTMKGAGKKITLAGREYEILPIKIEDMDCIFSEDESKRIIIPDKEAIDKGEMSWTMFGLNVIGDKKQIFMKMINKYVFYKETPMTEKLLNEHNWSFKEIGKFLYFWIQEVSE